MSYGILAGGKGLFYTGPKKTGIAYSQINEGDFVAKENVKGESGTNIKVRSPFQLGASAEFDVRNKGYYSYYAALSAGSSLCYFVKVNGHILRLSIKRIYFIPAEKGQNTGDDFRSNATFCIYMNCRDYTRSDGTTDWSSTNDFEFRLNIALDGYPPSGNFSHDSYDNYTYPSIGKSSPEYIDSLQVRLLGHTRISEETICLGLGVAIGRIHVYKSSQDYFSESYVAGQRITFNFVGDTLSSVVAGDIKHITSRNETNSSYYSGGTFPDLTFISCGDEYGNAIGTASSIYMFDSGGCGYGTLSTSGFVGRTGQRYFNAFKPLSNNFTSYTYNNGYIKKETPVATSGCIINNTEYILTNLYTRGNYIEAGRYSGFQNAAFQGGHILTAGSKSFTVTVSKNWNYNQRGNYWGTGWYYYQTVRDARFKDFIQIGATAKDALGKVYQIWSINRDTGDAEIAIQTGADTANAVDITFTSTVLSVYRDVNAGSLLRHLGNDDLGNNYLLAYMGGALKIIRVTGNTGVLISSRTLTTNCDRFAFVKLDNRVAVLLAFDESAINSTEVRVLRIDTGTFSSSSIPQDFIVSSFTPSVNAKLRATEDSISVSSPTTYYENGRYYRSYEISIFDTATGCEEAFTVSEELAGADALARKTSTTPTGSNVALSRSSVSFAEKLVPYDEARVPIEDVVGIAITRGRAGNTITYSSNEFVD